LEGKTNRIGGEIEELKFLRVQLGTEFAPLDRRLSAHYFVALAEEFISEMGPTDLLAR